MIRLQVDYFAIESILQCLATSLMIQWQVLEALNLLSAL